MAYLVVEVHHAYKIWCPRGAVKEKPGKKENSSNSLRGGDFHQDKTAIFSNGCFRPRIFSPSVRSGTRRVVTDDPLRLFRIPGVRTGEAKGVPGKRFALSFPPGPGGFVPRSVITVSYRADARRRFPSRCQGLAGGYRSAASEGGSVRGSPCREPARLRLTSLRPHSFGLLRYFDTCETAPACCRFRSTQFPPRSIGRS